MATLTLKETIAAPIDEVFARAIDFVNAPQAIRGIEKVEMLTDGSVGKGTRFRETRTMFGREAVEEMEITRFEPPSLYALGANSHGCEYLSTFRLHERQGSTEIELTFESTPLTLSAKVMSFLMKPMLKTVASECAKDLADLKRSIEEG